MIKNRSTYTALKVFAVTAFAMMAFVITEAGAEETVHFHLQFVSGGFGINISPEKTNLELSSGIFNLFMDHKSTSLMFMLSPASIRVNIEARASKETVSVAEMSFINFCMSWNALAGTGVMLGPFFSLRYLTVRDWNWEGLDFRNVTAGAGIKLMDRSSDYYDKYWKPPYNMDFEIGWRYHYYDGHQFYFCMNADMVSSIVSLVDIISQLSPPPRR